MTALRHLRVLECGDFVAAPYASKLLAHMGAEVVKVEPRAGDSNRSRGPFPEGRAGLEGSALHLYLNQAKQSVVLDLDTDEGRQGLAQLAKGADVVIASGTVQELQRKGLTYAQLEAVNPALVVASITPFGLTSTRATPAMRELCDIAAGGWLSISPGDLGNAALPPLKPFGQQSHFQGGIHTAVAIMGALAERDRSGTGQQVDVSLQAVLTGQLEGRLTQFTYNQSVASRFEQRLVAPWGTIQLADGKLFILGVTDDEWRRLVAFLGSPGWAKSKRFNDRIYRRQLNHELLLRIEQELQNCNVMETYATLLMEHRVPCAPVYTVQELLAQEHLRAREAFVEVDHPSAGKWTYPGAPWKSPTTPWQVRRRAPLLGEHQAVVTAGWSTPPHAAPLAPATQASGLPLEGVRVLDLTWVWAGPFCTLQLAHLGADVLKLESSTRVDTARRFPPFLENKVGPNRSGVFNQYNQGKRSVAVNLKSEKGRALVYELVQKCDVVVDNFSGNALARMGFTYETLSKLNPKLIQISMSGHGQTGPLAKFISYGPMQLPMTGLLSLTGYPDGSPREVGMAYTDANAGIHGALAVLVALHHRRRTGQGQYIDLSQAEAAIPLVIEGLMRFQMTGAVPARIGNRDEFQSPQGVFRCAGEDRWVAISCWSDTEWRALARLLGRPELADDPTLSTAQGRKARDEELETAIEAWTSRQSAEAVAAACQAEGVSAFPVFTTEDLSKDLELAARGYWVTHRHPEVGDALHGGIPWLLSRTPLRVRAPSPTLGQHTDEVLHEVLGLSPEALAALRADHVLE